MPSRKTSSRTRSDTLSAGLNPTLRAQVYLQKLLPPGWERFFLSRAAGNAWGLSIQCPKCGEATPRELKYSARKWRWLSVHITQCPIVNTGES